MILEIRDIKERGNEAERVIFIAKEDGDIGSFFVFSAEAVGIEKISSHVNYPFWFPDKEVRKDDLIVLYTKEGTNSFKKNKDGTISHFYYRNVKNAILNANTKVLLVEADNWAFK